MSVMANGWGSREKARIALKRMNHVPKQDENPTSVSSAAQSDEEIVDATKPVASSADMQQFSGSKRSIGRLILLYYLLMLAS